VTRKPLDAHRPPVCHYPPAGALRAGLIVRKLRSSTTPAACSPRLVNV